MSTRTHRTGMLGVVAAALGLTTGGSGALAKPPEGVNVPSYAQFSKDNAIPMIIRSAIPGVNGRIDKIAFDPERYYVFITGVRAGSVYIQNLATHKTVQRLDKLPQPRAVAYFPDQRRLAVACGGDGSVRVFLANDKGEFEPERSVDFLGEADGLTVEPPIFDDASLPPAVWVSHAMSVHRMDVLSGEKSREIRLPGRADGVAFGTIDGKRRLFINVPRPDSPDGRPEEKPAPVVVVADPDTGTIESVWPLKDASPTSAIAVDEANARLFVTTKDPGKLIVLDAKTGQEVNRLDAPADAGVICYDAALQRIFVPGGAAGGKIAVYQRTGVGAPLDKVEKKVDSPFGAIDRYEQVYVSATTAGCRTAVLDPNERLLIAAAPSLGADPVFIFVYMIGP